MDEEFRLKKREVTKDKGGSTGKRGGNIRNYAREKERRESEVWKIVNRKRRKVRRVNKGIRREEWEEYFMSLLGGIGNRMVRGEERRSREEDGEENLSGGERLKGRLVER